MRGILADCVAEMIDRKMPWIYGAAAILGILLVLGVHQLESQFGSEGMGAMQEMEEAMKTTTRLFLYHKSAYYLVFLSVMVTAGLIPRMLERGRADFYLSKPVSKRSLLFNKLLAVWLVYGAMICLVMLIEWVVGGLAFGVFDAGVGYMVLTNLAALLVWLSIIAFAGIVSGSGPTSILVAFAFWVIQQVVGLHDLAEQLTDSPILRTGADILYYVFPKTIEMSETTLEYLTKGSFDWMPLYSSLIFALALLYLTVFIFSRRDY